MLIGYLAVYAAAQFYNPRWAEIEDVTAIWDIADQTALLRITFDKKRECRRVLVEKRLQPLDGDIVQSNRAIPLKGSLHDFMVAAPLGTTTIFDEAAPDRPVPPGHYQLVIIADCEQPTGDRPVPASSLLTIPVTTTVIVRSPAASIMEEDELAKAWRAQLAARR